MSSLPTKIRTRQSKLFITKSRQVLNFSKDRNSAISVDNTLLCMTNPQKKNDSLDLHATSHIYVYFCLCSLPVVLSVGMTWKCLITFSLLPLSGIYIHEKELPDSFFLKAEQCLLSLSRSHQLLHPLRLGPSINI